MVVDALEIAVCLVVNLLTKVLVCLGPHLRKVSYNIENPVTTHYAFKNRMLKELQKDKFRETKQKFLANSLFSFIGLMEENG